MDIRAHFLLSKIRSWINALLFLTFTMLVSCTPAPAMTGNCGNKIAFISDRDRPGGDIFLINPDGSDLDKVDMSPVVDDIYSITWSPDCEHIMFSTVAESTNIYIVNADGTYLTLLTDFEVKYQIFYFVGQLFGFGFGLVEYSELSDEEYKYQDIEYKDIEGGPNDPFVGYPDWSPDGEQIALSAGYVSADGAFMHFGIFIVNSDGSGIRPLFTDLEVLVEGTRSDLNEQYSEEEFQARYGFNLFPKWSPDSKWITFLSMFPENAYLANIDGDETIRLMEDESRVSLYTISPDWLNIAYVTGDGLFIGSIEGNDLTQIDGGEGPIISLAWSPDGKQLMFISTHNLYLVNSDGSGLTILVEDIDVDVDRDWGTAVAHSWSPDGRQVVYSHGQNIYIINTDGTGLFELVDDFGSSFSPIWSPGDVGIEFRP